MFSTVKFLEKTSVFRFYSVFSPEAIFNEENIRKTVGKFAKMQPLKTAATVKQPVRNAAVLIPLCVVDDKVSLLYTLRAANLNRHRGQVSFPGGMEDAGDKSVEHTALRETEEELGISQNRIQIWGKGNMIVDRDRVTSILPVIGVVNINIQKDLSVNPSEVKEVFTVPLEVLCDPKNVKHTQFRNYSLPVFLGGKRKIWGLTAIITHLFLKALLPRENYNFSIKYIPPLKGSLPYRLV